VVVVRGRLTGDLRPKGKMRITSLVHAYDVIKMCAPPAPPIRLRIRTFP